MKTTVDIHDELSVRTKRRVPESSATKRPYRLPDRRLGDPTATNPLAGLSWPELRELIYGGTGPR